MMRLTDIEKEEQKKQKQLIAEAIGEAIRFFREKKDFSQNYVSELSRLERNVFQRYDSGKVAPGIYNLIKIAKALEMNPEDIVQKAYKILQANPKFNS